MASFQRGSLVRWAAATCFALATLLSASAARAVKVNVNEDTFLDVRFLLQPWARLTYDPTKSNNPDNGPLNRKFQDDFYLRRARIILAGQITKWVSFFAETDQPNWGMNGDWSTSAATYIQDAFLTFNIHEAFKVDFGMLLLPFIHNSLQSAASLHTLDYHSDVNKYPIGTGKNTGSQTWRSTGFLVRGLLLNKKLDYRVAFTNGVADGQEVVAATATMPAIRAHTGYAPRITGRVAFNALDAEEGYFLGGTYLGTKKVLSAALAFDIQPGVFGKDTAYYGLGADIFLDLPLANKQRLSGQLAYVYYGGEYNPDRGNAVMFDLGYAIGKWEPIIAIDWFRPTVAANADDFNMSVLGIHYGVAYWWMGHNANFKLDISQYKTKKRDFGDVNTVAVLQTQLFF